MYLNENYEYITDNISKTKTNIKHIFNDWLNIKNNHLSKVNITPREVNERMYTLNKPFNSYCKVNYIDNNFIVDQILQMSLPYSDGRHLDDRGKNPEYTIINNINPDKLIIYNGSFEEKETNKNIDNNESNPNKAENWNEMYQSYIKPSAINNCIIYSDIS